MPTVINNAAVHMPDVREILPGGCMEYPSLDERYTSGTAIYAIMAYTAQFLARISSWCKAWRNARYPAYANQRTSMVVTFGSQLHVMPHASMANIQPVIRASAPKTKPSLTEDTATKSHVIFLYLRYRRLAMNVMEKERNERMETGKWKKNILNESPSTARGGICIKKMYMAATTIEYTMINTK